MAKTILVIGSNSTLARAVLPLLTKDNSIITAGRHDCDIYCDVTEEVVIPSGVDVVINFTANFGGYTDKEIDDATKTNVAGVLRICEAAKAANVAHVINISSIFALLRSDDPQYSVYALTKRQGDELATHYCQQNKLPLTVLRPSRIYGDSHDFAKGQPFFYKLLDTAAGGEDITLYGTGETRRNYIHADDLAEVLIRIIQHQTTGSYSCVYPSDTSYRQIAIAAQKAYGKGGNITYIKDKPDAESDISVQDHLLFEDIDFWPKITIESGIERIKQYGEKGIA